MVVSGFGTDHYDDNDDDDYDDTGPARVVLWLDHLGAMCSAVGSRFNSSRCPVRRVCLRKRNYVKIIPTNMMIREIIPGRQQRVRRCPL